ncbi:FecCD family ABC transporter permease [Corynebacterium pacaense]|uniref:FecCD family ABC transporter permease n=1 Tax=Corynebacterium pacaense TaxID=1816684 RepID=UPI003CCBF281
MLQKLSPWLWAVVGITAVVFSIGMSVTFGPVHLSTLDAWQVILNRVGLGPAPELSTVQAATVWELRMPRALMAGLAGAGLGLCGVVLQSLLRNQLADPFILGVSSGASTGAVLVVVTSAAASALAMSAGAFLGALLSFALVLLLTRAAGGGMQKIILAGVAITQLFSALTSFIIMMSADSQTTRGVLHWLLGSLSSSSWETVGITAVVLLLCAGVIFLHSQVLDAFAFGEDSAAALGIDIVRTRLVLLLVTALLTATIVASSGAIGFVGLVMPHVCRLLVGSMHRRLIPMVALWGAVFMIWVDTMGRTIADPVEIPVGVITALVGVPIFAIILIRFGRRSR